jgi:hypothetical protein
MCDDGIAERSRSNSLQRGGDECAELSMTARRGFSSEREPVLCNLENVDEKARGAWLSVDFRMWRE